jgi:hypothetical protein
LEWEWEWECNVFTVGGRIAGLRGCEAAKLWDRTKQCGVPLVEKLDKWDAAHSENPRFPRILENAHVTWNHLEAARMRMLVDGKLFGGRLSGRPHHKAAAERRVAVAVAIALGGTERDRVVWLVRRV